MGSKNKGFNLFLDTSRSAADNVLLLCVSVCVCPSVYVVISCKRNISESYERILVKFFWRGGAWPWDELIRRWWQFDNPFPYFAPPVMDFQ